MIQIHLRIQVALDKRAAFLEFLRDAIPFYEQPGGIRIRLLEDVRDATRFIEVVDYETREAYERDQQRVEQDPTMQSYLKRWRALLDGPPTVETYSEAACVVSSSSGSPGAAT